MQDLFKIVFGSAALSAVGYRPTTNQPINLLARATRQRERERGTEREREREREGEHATSGQAGLLDLGTLLVGLEGIEGIESLPDAANCPRPCARLWSYIIPIYYILDFAHVAFLENFFLKAHAKSPTYFYKLAVLVYRPARSTHRRGLTLI